MSEEIEDEQDDEDNRGDKSGSLRRNFKQRFVQRSRNPRGDYLGSIFPIELAAKNGQHLLFIKPEKAAIVADKAFNITGRRELIKIIFFQRGKIFLPDAQLLLHALQRIFKLFSPFFQ